MSGMVHSVTEAREFMPRQIDIDDVVDYWRVGRVSEKGRVTAYMCMTRAQAEELAVVMSTNPDVHETWMRPVLANGVMGRPVRYFRNGQEVH